MNYPHLKEGDFLPALLKSNCTYNDNGVEKCIVNLGFFIDAMKEE